MYINKTTSILNSNFHKFSSYSLIVKIQICVTNKEPILFYLIKSATISGHLAKSFFSSQKTKLKHLLILQSTCLYISTIVNPTQQKNNSFTPKGDFSFSNPSFSHLTDHEYIPLHAALLYLSD